MLKTHPSFQTLGYRDTIQAEVRLEHMAWRKDASEAERLRPRLEAMGYTQDGLLAYAFAKGAESIAQIEHLMASCRRQLSRLINEAMVRKEFRIRANHSTERKIPSMTPLTGIERARKMASKRQIEANRRNALLSSGPRTIQGILRSRANSLKHGLSVPIAETDEGASKIFAIQELLLLDSNGNLSPDSAWAMAVHHAELHRIRRAHRSPRSQGTMNVLDTKKSSDRAKLGQICQGGVCKTHLCDQRGEIRQNLQNEANLSSDERDDTIDLEPS